MTSVVVFDYGFGNVRSMVRALADLDLDVTLTSDHRQALEANGLVVPGVGAFGACMEGSSACRATGARRVRGRADHVRTRYGTRHRHSGPWPDQGRRGTA